MSLLLSDLPIRQGYTEGMQARAMLESHKWPSVPVLNFDSSVTISNVVNVLEGQFFEGGWMLSYHDYGSVLNMRRPDETDKNGNMKQIHARFRILPTGKLQCAAHTEYSPIQNPQWHLQEKDLSWSKGQSRMVKVISGSNIGESNISKAHS